MFKRREMDSWEQLFAEAFELTGESWADVVSSTMTSEEMRAKFHAGYGGTEGIAFTVWTERKVYFPICYDGSEWVGFVSRNPDGQPTEHQGGG